MSRLPLADRRDQLITAALTIAARDGIEAATVRAVAVEAGVSAGVVHYCFSDKNELLTCMARAITELNTPQVVEAARPEDEAGSGGNDQAEVDDRTGGDDRAEVDDQAEGDDQAGGIPASDAGGEAEPPGIGHVLTELVTAMWSSLEATPGYQLLTYELTVTALRSPELDGVAQSQYEASRAAASAALQYAASAAQVTWTRPVEDLARIVLSAIDGAALAWLVDKDADAAKRTLAATVDLLSSYAKP